MQRTLSILLMAMSALAAGALRAGGTPVEPVVVHADELDWTELPTGVRRAVLQGDPAAEGPFTLRLQYPTGYQKAPHYHPKDAYVTVLEGSYYRAYGTTFDKSRGIALKAGTFSVNPAGVSHYEWTAGPALIQVTATGPWTTVYVDADGSPLPEASE